jgi:hypothetical protein
MKVIAAVLLAAMLLLSSGCAGITGLVTGPFTGAVDLPAETYRQNSLAFEQNPMLYGVDAIVVGPCGIVLGPVAGFIKGISLDIERVCGKVSYGQAFGTYNETSIWRPCTIKWSGTAPAHPVAP